MFGILLAILGGLLLFTGSVPVGRFWRTYNFSAVGNIWARLSGLMIYAGLFTVIFDVGIPYRAVVFFGGALLLLVVAMLKELSGPIR